ncbi:MAG TPA: hypothetical protein VKA67_09790, partial [Verrucomicrobiae bacterium]|nr:hypothetical protein [Verrucomicrobiae bacterium]
MVLLLLLTTVILVVLFHRSFESGQVLFSNDGPLGVQMAHFLKLPAGFFGTWYDIQWLGSNTGSIFPTLSSLIRWVLGPLGYSNFYIPIAILFLALSAGFFFKQLKLAPVACVLGGLAAALNSDFFSESAWGLASHGITFGFEFLALAALVDTSTRRRWLKVILAGLAVGMGIMEGADIGAIFSLYIAAFVMHQAWMGDGVPAARLSRGVIRTVVVAIFAALISAQALTNLIGTQIKGI